jgi:ferritin-like protein
MEIDRQTLIKLLDAFADVSEVLQRELMLYQTLFTAACKAKGLDENATQQLVEQARVETATRIRDASHANYQDLLAKIPRMVDMLSSNQDSALRLLNDWKPKGPPN